MLWRAASRCGAAFGQAGAASFSLLARNAACRIRNGDEKSAEDYASALRKCATATVPDLKSVHRQILGSPHSGDRLLQNLLIEMYGKLGSLEDARGVFERISRRNVFSWTMMIAAYAQYGHLEEALQVFLHMLQDGTKPDRVSFLKALQACTRLEEGTKVHQMVVESGMGTDVLLGNAMVNMYGKLGSLEAADAFFEGMRDKDVVSWNTMLAVYAQHGEYSKALEFFRRMVGQSMVKPDNVTYVSLLEVCGNLDCLEEGELVHARIRKDGLETDSTIANSLMNMYGKLGALEKARSVFDQMEERNIISWNTIIGAYTQNGCKAKALEIFRRMDLECVPADKVTYVHVFDAAGVGELRRIHDRVSAIGLDSDTVVRNSLVHLHGKCGSLEEARRLFENQQSKNVSSWNSIVDAYANQGLDREAFGLYSRMQQHGFKADKVTFLCVIEACSSLSEGKQVHEQATSCGLQHDIVVQTALLQMYTKHGSLEKAKKVFDGMQGRDIFAWNSLLTAYAHYGVAEEATGMFYEMMLQGMKPDEVTFVNLLDACSTSCNSYEGMKIHECAREAGFGTRSVTVGNTLISMYARCGCLMEARLVFDRMQEKSGISWNAMMLAYVQQEKGEMVFDLLNRMQLEGTKPDRVTCITCLDACKDLSQAKRMQTLILAGGLQMDTAVGNSLINTYRRCESLEESALVFNSMQERDVVSWTSMISAYGDSGFPKQALLLWQELQVEGIKPDGVTFGSVLEGCSRVLTLAQGEMLHLQVKDSGVENSPPVGPALIAMYSCCGSLERARRVFDKMEAGNRDVFVWNAMLAAYSQHGDGKQALQLFKRMDLEGIPSNTVTVVTALDSCSKNTRGFIQARAIHRSIISNLILDNTLVNVYGKCGSLRDAKAVFDAMPERALVTWNSIIATASQHGVSNDARKLFWRMQQDGVKPDQVTLMSIASSCQHAGQLGEAFYYLFQVCGEYGVKLEVEHYACIVGLLGRAGWLDEAEMVIARMPFPPNVMVWKNLLVSCRIHGDSNRGARVTKELWKLDPADSAPYVMLSNMYTGD